MYYPNYQSPYMPNNNYLSQQYGFSNQQATIPPLQQQNVSMGQNFGLSGRIINDVSEINANEVPMDGTRAVFIKSDGKEIYTKQWQSDGTIQTKVFSEVLTNNPIENTPKDQKFAYEPIFERLDGIEQRFDELEKLLEPKTAKKETK